MLGLKLLIFLGGTTLLAGTPLDNTKPAVTSPRAEEDEAYRLPENAFVPTNYLLNLFFAEDTFETNIFTGTLYLTFTAKITTPKIQIHANEKLVFSQVSLRTQNGVQIPLADPPYVLNNVTEILEITSSVDFVAEDNYILFFEYTAELRTDEMYGFYKSDYVDANNVRQYLATTQFQPTNARRAFPCFDEPSFKAQFDMRITHPSRYTARSNTPSTVYELDGGTTLTVFKSTPLMSTYLIAFIVSEFTCDQGDDLYDGVPYAVCSREEAAPTRELAVAKGPPLLRAIEDFTQIKYTVSTIGKMDQYAIPDFAAGAMENWGLVTYRETALLWDKLESSNRYMQRIETVIAHEFAHMWFGNLITCHWWSDTFLNEGFATYFEYFATGDVEPGWEMEKQFVIEVLQPALVTDASPTSSALSSPASSPAQVSSRFSTVSYSKGGSVFRMVEHLMGTANFKLGITAYLQANLFGNTRPTDLWNALNPFAQNLPAGTNLGTVMDAWIVNPGFPVLTATLQGQNVVISQKRFLTSGTSDTEKWYVPVSYTTSEEIGKFQDTSARVWLTPTGDVTINNAITNADQWIVINNRETGFYRVNYDDALYERIRNALNQFGFGGIHELNRAQIVDDHYNLARNGLQSYSRLLDLLSYLSKEVAYAPWYAAFSAFNNMLIRTGNPEIRAILSDYILNLMDSVRHIYIFDEPNDGNQIYTHNRVQVQTWSCRLGSTDCIQNSRTAFAAFRSNSSIIVDKNLRPVIYCNALRHSTTIAEDWNFLWEQYQSTKLATEQVVILAALGCTTDVAVLNNYLTKSITADSGIRPQDALSVFSSVYTGNPEGVDIALDFLLSNHQAITNYYTSMNSLNNLVQGIAGRFTSQDQLTKLEDFLTTPNLPESLQIAGTQAIDAAKTNLEFIEAFERELDVFFARSSAGVISSTRISIAAIFTAISFFLGLLY